MTSTIEIAPAPLGQRSFASKEDAQRFFQTKVLNQHRAFSAKGALLGPNALELVRFLLRTYHMFPAIWEGVSAGLVFMVPAGHRVLVLGWPDGRTRQVRPVRMFGGRQGPKSRFSDACRSVVEDVTRSFAKSFFAGTGPHTCPVTGALLTPDNADVDHAPPMTFANIVDMFLSVRVEYEPSFARQLSMTHREDGPVNPARIMTIMRNSNAIDPNITYASIGLEHYAPHPENDATIFGPTMQDTANAFRAFHSCHASLRVISRYANRVLLPVMHREERLVEGDE